MLDIIFQFIRGVDRHAVDGGVDHGGRYIERSVHRKAGAFKGEVVQHGTAQVADAHENQVVIVIYAQNMADLGAKLLHIVAIALLAKFAEAAEILADLRGGDVHFLSQRM